PPRFPLLLGSGRARSSLLLPRGRHHALPYKHIRYSSQCSPGFPIREPLEVWTPGAGARYSRCEQCFGCSAAVSGAQENG
ncbi:unnamed protein product, partial [Closterium sp. NIES-65]